MRWSRMSEDIDVTPRDALEIAQRALAKVNEQEQRIDDLEAELERLQARVPETTDYDDLDRDTKVGMVREHLVDRAQSQHGKATLDYQDVMWGVFDGEPSAHHCYDLMELAATATGFELRDPSDGNRRVAVDLDRTKRLGADFSGNKGSSERGEI